MPLSLGSGPRVQLTFHPSGKTARPPDVRLAHVTTSPAVQDTTPPFSLKP